METETLATNQQIEAEELELERKKLEEDLRKLPVAFKFKDWETTRKAVWFLIGLSLVFGLIVLAQ